MLCRFYTDNYGKARIPNLIFKSRMRFTMQLPAAFLTSIGRYIIGLFLIARVPTCYQTFFLACCEFLSNDRNYYLVSNNCGVDESTNSLSFFTEKVHRSLVLPRRTGNVLIFKGIHNTAQKMKFSFGISSVNVTKSTVFCKFGHIY